MEESCKFYDVACGARWLRDELHAFALWVYESILSGFASLVELIPVPEFFSYMSSVQIPPGISFFLAACQVTFGMQVIVSAYVARFVLRRIPVIG